MTLTEDNPHQQVKPKITAVNFRTVQVILIKQKEDK